MGYMITLENEGVAVIECDTCNECPVTLVIDGHEVKEYFGETALHDAERDASEEIIKRVHGISLS